MPPSALGICTLFLNTGNDRSHLCTSCHTTRVSCQTWYFDALAGAKKTRQDMPASLTDANIQPHARLAMAVPPVTSGATSSSDASPTNLSPPSQSPVPPGKRGKRQRACLSCVRCHRLKVKCDKGLPCTRCCQSGFGRQCEYTHRVEAAPVMPSPVPFTREKDNPEKNVAAWHFRPRGSSNWRELVTKVNRLYFTTTLSLTHI